MRDSGFAAREAISWLRIMRPGSVIGEQQHLLCRLDHRFRQGAEDALSSIKSSSRRLLRAQGSDSILLRKAS